MKKLFVSAMLLGLLSCHSSKKDSLLSFKLLLTDSTTIFEPKHLPDGRPIILIYFSPDCEHCQQEAKELTSRMDQFKNVNFYFFSDMPISEVSKFYTTYGLNKYPNITLGKDMEYFFIRNFKPQATPCFAVFNKDKQLKMIFNGETSLDTLSKALKDIE